MEKAGIVYLMKTVIKGVYKIGISDVSNFEGRMRHLENNGSRRNHVPEKRNGGIGI